MLRPRNEWHRLENIFEHGHRINYERCENGGGERERGEKSAEATSISSVRWLAIFFLLISASPVVVDVFSRRNTTLYELCTRRVRLSVRSFVHPTDRSYVRAFSAATELNVRGLWRAELRVVIHWRERRVYARIRATGLLRPTQVLMFLAGHLYERSNELRMRSVGNNAENTWQL